MESLSSQIRYFTYKTQDKLIKYHELSDLAYRVISPTIFLTGQYIKKKRPLVTMSALLLLFVLLVLGLFIQSFKNVPLCYFHFEWI